MDFDEMKKTNEENKKERIRIDKNEIKKYERRNYTREPDSLKKDGRIVDVDIPDDSPRGR